MNAGVDCDCGNAIICRYGLTWRVWCWVLDICSECEQIYPFHTKTCSDREADRAQKLLDTKGHIELI